MTSRKDEESEGERGRLRRRRKLSWRRREEKCNILFAVLFFDTFFQIFMVYQRHSEGFFKVWCGVWDALHT